MKVIFIFLGNDFMQDAIRSLTNERDFTVFVGGEGDGGEYLFMEQF